MRWFSAPHGHKEWFIQLLYPCVWKSQKALKYSKQPVCPPNSHPIIKVTDTFDVNIIWSCWPVCEIFFFITVLPHDWQISYPHECAAVQVCLLKWMVSVYKTALLSWTWLLACSQAARRVSVYLCVFVCLYVSLIQNPRPVDLITQHSWVYGVTHANTQSGTCTMPHLERIVIFCRLSASDWHSELIWLKFMVESHQGKKKIHTH